MRFLKILALAALFVFIAAAFASTPTTIEWSWQAPPSTGVAIAGYNLYEIPGQCPATVSTAGIAPVNGVSLITNLVYDQPYQSMNVCAFVTSVSNMGVESAPSATFQANTAAPAAPGAPHAVLK